MATDYWKVEAHTQIKRLSADIRSIMSFCGIHQLKLVIGGTADIASLPTAQPPILLIGRKWVAAMDDRERLKRVIHEIYGHCMLHLEHGDEAREQGYFSSPERDTKSWEWYDAWCAWRGKAPDEKLG